MKKVRPEEMEVGKIYLHKWMHYVDDEKRFKECSAIHKLRGIIRGIRGNKEYVKEIKCEFIFISYNINDIANYPDPDFLWPLLYENGVSKEDIYEIDLENIENLKL